MINFSQGFLIDHKFKQWLEFKLQEEIRQKGKKISDYDLTLEDNELCNGFAILWLIYESLGQGEFLKKEFESIANYESGTNLDSLFEKLLGIIRFLYKPGNYLNNVTQYDLEKFVKIIFPDFPEIKNIKKISFIFKRIELGYIINNFIKQNEMNLLYSDDHAVASIERDNVLKFKDPNGKSFDQSFISKNQIIESIKQSLYKNTRLDENVLFVANSLIWQKDNFDINFYQKQNIGLELIKEIVAVDSEAINRKLDDGTTNLMLAIENDDFELAKFLIERNINVNATDLNNATALHKACVFGNRAIVKLLIDSDADVNAIMQGSLTPLYIASKNGFKGIVADLIANKAAINPGEGFFPTPLEAATEKGHAEIVRMLIRHGADLERKNLNYESPVFIACRNGYIDIVKFFCENYATIFATDLELKTSLHTAVITANLKIVMILIVYFNQIKENIEQDNKNYINQKDKHGNTALHYACIENCIEIAEYLIIAGAGTNFKNGNEQTPLHIVCENNNFKIAKLLIKSGASNNFQNSQGDTPLHVACLLGNDEIIEVFANSNINLDLGIKNKFGKNPLHQVIVSNKVDAVYAFFKLNPSPVDKDSQDKEGNSPSHLACITENLEIMRLLLAAKVNINLQNADGETPLHIAAANGNYEITELLLQNGADIKVKNTDGKKALDLAEDVQAEGIVQLLKKYSSQNQSSASFFPQKRSLEQSSDDESSFDDMEPSDGGKEFRSF